MQRKRNIWYISLQIGTIFIFLVNLSVDIRRSTAKEVNFEIFGYVLSKLPVTPWS